MSSKIILDELLECLDENVLRADGYDDCIIGFTQQAGRPSVLAYDTNKMIAKLISEGMDMEEAWEFFEFNIAGAYVGEYTPVFITKMAD
jgi:hypothetical protein